MFLVNSRLGLFTAAPSCSSRRGFTLPGRSLSRSYGARLPSSLTRVISSALGFSPHPPVSVYSTVTLTTRLGVFLGSMDSASLCPEGLLITSQGLNGAPDLPGAPPYGLELRIPTRRWLIRLRHPMAQAPPRWYRNISLFPITYAFRPRLRTDLP